MPRTNEDLVIKVLGDDYGLRVDGSTPDLSVYMDTAESMVDDLVECAAALGKTLTTSKLELIERWLSAHFYAVNDKPYQSKSTNKASASFVGQTGMYLESTLYGQMAVRLDPTGCLTSQGKTISGMWLGKTVSEQIDYDDRN